MPAKKSRDTQDKSPRRTPSPDMDAELAELNDSRVISQIKGSPLAKRYQFFQEAVPLPTLRSTVLSSVNEHSPMKDKRHPVGKTL